MKMIVLALAGTIAVATPAYAQSSYGSYREASSDRRIDALHYQVDEGIRRGTISRGEATRLTDQLWQIRRLENEYARNGFSSWERTDLDRRITFLQDQLRGQDDGDYRRGDGYDPYAGYGADTSGGGSPPPGYQEDYPQTSDNPAYSEYPDHDTPGIQTYDPDNDYVPLDQGGASDPGYSDGEDDPYGLQGTDLDDYNGANDDAGGPPSDLPPMDDGPDGDLNVGDTAPSYLGAVPPDLRGLYPDGSGLTYRFDGERVYQIETSTNRIRWIGELR